jgi:hypothetical protein
MVENDIALEVVKVLTLISDPPNPRPRPQAGDLQGRFDVWFDGGAVKHDTGISAYRFVDGAMAVTGTSLRFSVVIRLPNRTFVRVQEDDVSSLPPTSLIGFD